MENPNSWEPVQKAIDAAIREHTKMLVDGHFELSLVSYIYEHLKELKMLNEEEKD